MIRFLRIVFGCFFVAITWAILWASHDTALWAIPPVVTGDAWFRATMVDIYISFFTFYTWVAYKERSWAARVGWFLAIVLLGSMAVTAYVLRQLFLVPADAPLEAVLLRAERGAALR